MAVTLASLRAAHPEFTETPDAVLSSAIAQAERRVDDAVFGDMTDDAVMLLACHLAAASSYGGGGRLTDASRERSIYWHDYNELVRTYGASWRLV